MKKLVVNFTKSTFVALLILVSSSIYAVGDVKVAPIEGSKKARVYVSSNENDNVKLAILNENGTEYLYSEELSKEASYKKVYDFNKLEDGAYKIVAESDIKIIEKDITVSEAGIEVTGETETYKPFFNVDENNNLVVSYLNTESNDVNVSFSNGTDVFFADAKVQDLNFMKAYSVADLEKGDYVVSLNSGENTYSYYFEVK